VSAWQVGRAELENQGTARSKMATCINILSDYSARLDHAGQKELHSKVSQWVGHTFYGTLMRQFRTSCDRTNMFTGGKAGMTFTRQLDQLMIDRLASGSEFDAGKVIADSWVGPLDK